eukprot:330293-Chlamydomonas_euryale.AAC.5
MGAGRPVSASTLSASPRHGAATLAICQLLWDPLLWPQRARIVGAHGARRICARAHAAYNCPNPTTATAGTRFARRPAPRTISPPAEPAATSPAPVNGSRRSPHRQASLATAFLRWARELSVCLADCQKPWAGGCSSL